MAQSIKQVPLNNSLQYTLASGYTAGGTTLTLNQDASAVLQAPGVVVVDRINSSGSTTPTLRTYYYFTGVSGANLTGLSVADGTDQAHAVGAIVEFIPDVKWAQSIYDALSQVVVPSTGLVDTTKVLAVSSKASSTDVATGTDDTKYLTALSIKNSKNVPNVVPSTSGNVLTSDGTNWTSATPAASSSDGWTASSDTWTYASASTFTIAGVDRTAVFVKGTRLKFTNSTLKYAVVISSSFSTNTTVTIATNTDYVIANAAISSPYYSYQICPAGYPTWFNYTVSFTGFSANPTGVTARFRVDGTCCTLNIFVGSNGTSNSTALTMTAPIAQAFGDFSALLGANVIDNGAAVSTAPYIYISNGTTTISCFKDGTSPSWTSSAAKKVGFVQGVYQI